MNAVLVNPNLMALRDDVFTTGVVYMPIGLAYVAASLRADGIPTCVVDAFGSEPTKTRIEGKFLVFGLECAEVVRRIPSDASVVFLYANQLANFQSMANILKAIKAARPTLPLVVVENTQAVTAFALRAVAKSLFDAGADYLLEGEAEQAAVHVARALSTGADASHLPGLSSRAFANPSGPKAAIDELPFPAWDLFPIRNYWSLHFAHGPLSSRRYLPLLTSRGCPYPCKFCVVPATNNQRWRGRSAASVVAEMEHWQQSLGVSEFHIEDLDPTIDDKRTQAICRAILDRKLRVRWKLVAGTKVETMRSEETIDLMAQAGCRYISISPESGSARVLKLMAKPFKVDHAFRLIGRMNRVGIRSQACFVIGFPGETDEDREMTRTLVRDLTRSGVDEIALFLVAPVPGSAIFDQLTGYQSLSELNFSPTWRADYPVLSRFRMQLYREFLIGKTLRFPLKIARQAFNFAFRRFETKMEMVPYRALVFRLRDFFARRSATQEALAGSAAVAAVAPTDENGKKREAA